MTNLDFLKETRNILKIHEVKNIQTPIPFKQILKRSECDLWIIGTSHTRDINDFQISILKKEFELFLNQSYKNPILCLEGSIPNDIEDETKAIEKYGEKAILISTAQMYGIKIVSAEPTQTEISEWATQLLDEPLVHAAWAVLNILINSKKSLPDALPSIAKTYGFKESTQEFYKTISEYLRHEKIVNLPNDLELLATTQIDLEVIRKAQEPNEGLFQTNTAGSIMNLARDYGLYSNTMKIANSKKHDGVFAWFGLNHVLAITPAFEIMDL